MDLRYDRQNLSGSSEPFLANEDNPYFNGGGRFTRGRRNDAEPDNLPQGAGFENLPILATSNDVREVVRFLKDKPEGLPVVEALNFEPRRVFEARKIAAYEYWGVVKRECERLKLTALGEKLVNIVALETAIFEELIVSIPVYLKAIKWIERQKLKVVTRYEIAGIWNQGIDEKDLEQTGGKNSEAEVVSFFSLCQAAGLGIFTVGKRGQPARLRIEPRTLRQFLSRIKSGQKASGERKDLFIVSNPANFEKNGNDQTFQETARVYFSAVRDNEETENLRQMLELADFESVLPPPPDADDYLGSGRIETMRSCQAGIITIEDSDCRIDCRGETEIMQERLTEIIVAAALFRWRVIVIWNALPPAPECLRAYNLFWVNGAARDFSTCYQTVKLLKNIKFQTAV